jgi:hypothetical protein
VATQIVEDGTPSSLIVRPIPYQYPIVLANRRVFSPFTFSRYFSRSPPLMSPLTLLLPSRPHWSRVTHRIRCTQLPSLSSLRYGPARAFLASITLYLTLTPLRSAAFLYFVLMIWIVVKRLREQRPLVYYMLAGILFILAQLTYFLLSRPICNGTNAKIDGSFLATALETASVIVLYLAWQGITEGSSISRRVCYPICSSTVRCQTTGTMMYTSNEWHRLFYYIR